MGTILMFAGCRCSMTVDGASWPRHFCSVVSDSLSCHEQWRARQLHDCSFLRQQQQLSVVIGHPCARGTIQHFRSTVFGAETEAEVEAAAAAAAAANSCLCSSLTVTNSSNTLYLQLALTICPHTADHIESKLGSGALHSRSTRPFVDIL